MKIAIFLLILPFLSVYSRPRPHNPWLGNRLDLGKGSWKMMKTCVSERRYCTFTVEDGMMVGECVEAEEVCWNIGYGWLEEKEDEKGEELKSVEGSNEEIVEFADISIQPIKDVDNQVEEKESFSVDVDIDNLAEDMESKKNGFTPETIEGIIDNEILVLPEAIIQTIKDDENQVEGVASFSVDVDIDNLTEDTKSKNKEFTSETIEESVNKEIVEFPEVIIQTIKDAVEEEVSFSVDVDIDNLAENMDGKSKELTPEPIDVSVNKEILFPEDIIQTVKDGNNQVEREASASIDVDFDDLGDDMDSTKKGLTSETKVESVKKEVLEFPEVIIQTIEDVDNPIEKEAQFSIDVDLDNLTEGVDSKKKGLTSEAIEKSTDIEIVESPEVIIQTIKDVDVQVEQEAQFSIDVNIDNIAKDMDSKKEKELTTEGRIPTLIMTTSEIDLENRDKKGMNVSLENNDAINKKDFEAAEEIIKVTKTIEDSVVLEPQFEVPVDVTLKSLEIMNETQPNEITTKDKLPTEVDNSTMTFIDVTEDTINYDIETATVEGSRKDSTTIENNLDTTQGSLKNILETFTEEAILIDTTKYKEEQITEIKVELEEDLEGDKENEDEKFNENLSTDEYEDKEAATKVTTPKENNESPAENNAENVTQMQTGEENQAEPELLTEDDESAKQIVVVTTSTELSKSEEGTTEFPASASETEIIAQETVTEAVDAQPVQESTPPVFLFNLIKQKFSNP